MITTVKKNFYKNGYLLIIAAWLYTISFIFSNYSSYVRSPSRVKDKFENYFKNAEVRFEEFSSDTAFIYNAVFHPENLSQFPRYLTDDIGLFLYTPEGYGTPALKYWSNNKILPDNKDITKSDGKTFSTYSNGDFEVIKKTILLGGKTVSAFAVIPIRYSYFIKNKYLQENFPAVEDVQDRYDLVRANAQFYIRNGDRKILFGLNQKKKFDDKPDTLPLAFRVIAIMFILVFINVLAFDFVNRKGWLYGFLFLSGTLFFIRLLTYFFPFPFTFRNLELFDPSIYASNSLHPSLGDLLINVILVFWLISFIKLGSINKLRNVKAITGISSLIVTGILSVFLIILSFTCAGVIRSLIIDSQISFDVTDYNSLTGYTIISFIILCFIILSFFHFSHLALLFINKCNDLPIYAKYLFIAVAGLFYLSFNIAGNAAASNLIVLVWLLVYIGVMEFRKQDIYVPVLQSSFFLLWLIFFTSSISALIILQNHYKEIDRGKRMAENLVRNADPEGETSMNIAVSDIKSEFLTANIKRLNSETTNKIIKDSLLKQNFPAILNKYNTRLYTFDRFIRPLYNEDSASFEAIASIIRRSKKALNSEIYYQNDINGISFLYPKEILDSTGNTAGYFFVVAESKKYKSHALYPELFTYVDDTHDDLDVTYGIYINGVLTNSFGEYNFLSKIPKEQWLKQEFKEITKDGTTEYWYNAGFNKLVIFVKSGSLFFESITLFAYLFGSFMFIVIIFRAGHFLIIHKFRWSRIRRGFKMNIRYQVQSSIIFISIFSFLIIGIATIFFYIKRFDKNNRDRLVKAIKELSVEIESEMAGELNFDGAAKIDDIGTRSEPERKIKKVAEIHNIEINFYDLPGNLTASSQPYIYEKKLLAPVMDPTALYNLRYNSRTQYIQEEHISAFRFLSIYVPVTKNDGQPYAYLSIPSLNSQKELNEEISSFLVTLINLNAFIFLIAGAISVFLTDRITRSFSLIADKMKDINLGKANEEIEWSATDEIGALVNEYNKMVKKLEDSARALAKSEREGAWREMARQVAHEIKNPLTPMKLSIQYLQRAIQDNNPNIVEMSKKVSATLVEQIDQLAKIASDFSQFANISKTHIEVFDVVELLTSLVDLYSSNEKLKITYNHADSSALLNADRTQINRLFTNLFQNAVEASEGKDVIPIIITQQVTGNKLHIKFTDEGSGIPLTKQDKIFTPNFTTKTSGTGLGLAMSKGIVENANGSIWFETEEGRGTTFHVVVPLMV